MSDRTNLERLAGQAELIFQGRVDRLGEATLPIVSATDATAVVMVEQILRRPPGLGDFSGNLITVQFATKPKPARRQELVIFARGWLYGTSMAVKECGHVRAHPSLLRRLIDIEHMLLERTLQQRVARAEVIVTGRVRDVRLLPADKESSGERSEWGEVLLEVVSWEKAPRREKPIRVVCPVRPNRRFPRAPVFHRAQEGLWMLRRTRVELLKETVFMAQDPHDFQSLERLELVRRLIQEAS